MSFFAREETDLAAAYDAYADMLYRLALSHLHDPSDAQDVVQDVFAKLCRSPLPFRDETHRRAFLIRATINQSRDALRRKKVRSYTPLSDLAPGDEPHSEDVFSTDLQEKLSLLPEKYRAVIVLHHLEGFSVEEVAKILKLSVSAVKMRLVRGREALKNSMQ